MPIIVNEVVTDKVSGENLELSSASGSIKIGSFTWPDLDNVPEGSVLKTDSTGELVFEPSVVRVTVVGTTYTILPGDDIIAITQQQDTTLTLPDPTTKNTGEIIYIVKEVSGTDTITILPNGTELLSGETSATLSFSFGTLKIYTNGVNWFVLV